MDKLLTAAGKDGRRMADIHAEAKAGVAFVVAVGVFFEVAILLAVGLWRSTG